jgi:hypothetical protein
MYVCKELIPSLIPQVKKKTIKPMGVMHLFLRTVLLQTVVERVEG